MVREIRGKNCGLKKPIDMKTRPKAPARKSAKGNVE
jgi:hypothetical protein